MSGFFFHSSTGPIHRLYHLPARPPVTITPSVIPIPCMYVCMSVCFLVLLLNHPTGLCQCSPQKSLILPPQMLCLPYDRAHHPSPITHHSFTSIPTPSMRQSLNTYTPRPPLSLPILVCVAPTVSICMMCMCPCHYVSSSVVMSLKSRVDHTFATPAIFIFSGVFFFFFFFFLSSK